MKLFSWVIIVDGEFVADGYLIAPNREEAVEKLCYIPCADRYDNEIITLSEDCGYDGVDIDEVGLIIRGTDDDPNYL